MVKRTLSLALSNGSVLDLPLLVPSFSSKGFPFFTEKRAGKTYTYSEITHALEQLGPYIKESLLLSAYDLHHKHFRQPEKHLRGPAAIFLDSGGYELNPEFDSTEPKITPMRQLGFTSQDYENFLARFWKKHARLPLVIANYDWETRNAPYAEQIRKARSLYRKFAGWSTGFILKPPGARRTVVEIDELIPFLPELRGFNIVGVTEKELGKNLYDRLQKLVRLRVEMTKRDIRAPIHVWGGLDPTITPLYFFAGADIFDGVSWLRYTYHGGIAANRDAYAVLQGNITTAHDHAVFLAMNQNLMALQGLTNSLRAFGNSAAGNFEVFEHNRDILQKAFRTMDARIPELKELY